MDTNNILNFDETGLQMDVISARIVVSGAFPLLVNPVFRKWDSWKIVSQNVLQNIITIIIGNMDMCRLLDHLFDHLKTIRHQEWQAVVHLPKNSAPFRRSFIAPTDR
jgi:hypothetical protein